MEGESVISVTFLAKITEAIYTMKYKIKRMIWIISFQIFTYS